MSPGFKNSLPLDIRLIQLEKAELVHRLSEEELAYLFNHALVHDTAYATLLKVDRKRLHREVGETMERVYAKRLDEQAAGLVLHFAEAGDDAKTLEYGIRAGDRADRLYANQEALHHYMQALDATKRSAATTVQLIHLYTQSGRLLQVLGQYTEALSRYDEMAALAQASSDRTLELATLMLRADAHASPIPTFNGELAQQLCNQALDLARELGDDAAQARILQTLTLLYTYTNRFGEAIEFGERSLAVARSLNDPGRDSRVEIGQALENLVLPYRATMQRARSEQVSAEARAIWRELDNKPMLAMNLGMAAQFAMAGGDLTQAVEWAAEGAALSHLIANPLSLLFSQRTLMMVHIEQGEWDQSLRLGEKALSLPQQASTVPAVTLSATLAWLLCSLGAVDRASDVEQRVRAAFSTPMPENFRAWAFADLARLNILRGDLEAAAADLASSYRHMDASSRASPAGYLTAFAESELALRRGEYGRALEQIEIQIRVSHRGGFEFLVPELLYWKGKMRLAQGDAEEARAAWREAATLAERMNLRRIGWQILEALGQVESERGNVAEAESLRLRAREQVEYLALHMPDDLRVLFWQLPEVRALVNLTDRSKASREAGL